MNNSASNTNTLVESDGGVKQLSALIPKSLHKRLYKVAAAKALEAGDKVTLTNTLIEVLEKGLSQYAA